MKSIKGRISVLLTLVLVVVGACALFMDGNKVKAADTNVDMLDVKMQISNTSVTDGNVSAHRAIRFISSVDSLDYSEVGFIVNGKSHAIYTVYEQIDSTLYEGDEKLEYTFSPKIVSTKSEYFFTAKMAVTEDKMNTDFTVQAYLKTFSGEVIVGEERVVCVAKDTASSAINLTVNGELDKAATYTAAFESKVNSEVTSVTETAAVVEVLSVGDGYSNVRITLTGSNTVADMASATVISINGTESTGVYRNYHTSYLSGTNAGKADTSWYDVYADGTEFVIATNADLYGLTTISENFAGDSVYLVSDIKANDGTASASGFTANEGATLYDWAPIGGATTDTASNIRNFAGTFDGQNHTISGIYLTKTGAANGSWGLFGETGVCTIKNFTLANSYLALSSVTNSTNIGSIAGKSTGTFDTIKVEDNVYLYSYGSQTEYAGGIVGVMSGADLNGGKITNCWFDGQVTGADYVGGILGLAKDGDATTAPTLHKKAVEIEHCLNSGNIVLNNNKPILGGLCSYVDYACVIINDSLNVSVIDLNNYTQDTTLTGSAIGWITANPYKDDATTAVSNNRYTAVINNTYVTKSNNWVRLAYRNGSGHTRIDGKDFTGSGLIYNTNTTTHLDIATLTGETGYMNMKLDFAIGEDYDGYWTATTETPILTSFADDVSATNKLALDEITTPRTLWYTADATEYTLYSMADMFGFASLTKVDFSGKTVKLGADITMNKGTASSTGFTPATTGATLVEWTPRNMAGTFDGDGHTIQGVYLDTATGNAGLFASVTGAVKNLRLCNSYINCTDATANNYASTNYLYGTGSIAGSLSGTLDTVYSDAIVKHTYAYAGGLVGTVYGDKQNLITNSCFAGEITARNAVGGIVGLVIDTSATIEHCLNSGLIATTDCVIGGLCGFVKVTDATAGHVVRLNDNLNIGRRDTTTAGTSTQAWAAGAGVGYMQGGPTVYANKTFYIRWYADDSASWTRFNYGTVIYEDAADSSINFNTYNVMTEAAVLAHNVDLTFLPEGQESSSTDAYYWVARDGKIPMLESFEDLLTDVTY